MGGPMMSYYASCPYCQEESYMEHAGPALFSGVKMQIQEEQVECIGCHHEYVVELTVIVKVRPLIVEAPYGDEPLND
jgi:phage terminase large subunit GpA-like protein